MNPDLDLDCWLESVKIDNCAKEAMAASVQQTLGGLPVNAPKRRKSYTREFRS